MIRRRVSIPLKIGISAALMYYVLHGIAPDLRRCGEQMVAAFRGGYAWLAAAVAFEAASFALASLRWRTILRGHDVAIGFGEALRLVLVGFFFGQFLPGGMAAGDVVRSYYIAARNDRRKTEAVTAVVVDRVIGFWGLVTLVVVSIVVGGEHVRRYFALMVGAVVMVVGTILFFSKRSLGKVPFADRMYRRLPYRGSFLRVYEALRHYKEHRLEMLSCWGQSVVIQFLMVAAQYCLGHSVGIRATALDYLVRIPIVGAIATIPISFGDIGTREAAYVVFFLSGEDPAAYRSTVLAFALMVRLLWLFIGAVGGIIWWGEKGKVPRKLMEQQEDFQRSIPQQ